MACRREHSLKIYPRPWKSRRERATDAHGLLAATAAAAAREMWNCDGPPSPPPPALPIRLTSTRSNVRLATFQPSSSSYLPPPLPASIPPTRHLSIPRQRPHEILRVDEAIHRSVYPPRSPLNCMPRHRAIFASRHRRASDFPDYIVRIFLRKMCTLVLFRLSRFSRSAFFPRSTFSTQLTGSFFWNFFISTLPSIYTFFQRVAARNNQFFLSSFRTLKIFWEKANFIFVIPYLNGPLNVTSMISKMILAIKRWNKIKKVRDDVSEFSDKNLLPCSRVLKKCLANVNFSKILASNHQKVP